MIGKALKQRDWTVSG